MLATLSLRQALSFRFVPSEVFSALAAAVAGGMLFCAAPAQASGDLTVEPGECITLNNGTDGYDSLTLKTGAVAGVKADEYVYETLRSEGASVLVDGSLFSVDSTETKSLYMAAYEADNGLNVLEVKGNNGINNVSYVYVSKLTVLPGGELHASVSSGGAFYWGTASDFNNWRVDSERSSMTESYRSVLCVGLGFIGEDQRGTGVELTPSMFFAVGDVGDASGNLVVGKGGVLALQDNESESGGLISGKLTVGSETKVQFLPGSWIWITPEAEFNDVFHIEEGAELLGIMNATLIQNMLEYGIEWGEDGFRVVEKEGQFRGVFGPAFRALKGAMESGDPMLPAFWERFFDNAVSFDMAGGSAENWAGLPAATGSDRALVDATAVTGGLVARGARLLKDADAVERARREAAEAKHDAKTGAPTHRFSLGAFPIEVDVTERRSDFGFTLTERSIWDFRREETEAGVTVYGRIRDGWWGVRVAGATADIATEEVRTNRFSGESDLVTAGAFLAWPTSWGTFSGTAAWAQTNDSSKMATADVFMTTKDVEQTIWSAGLGWTSPALLRCGFEGTLAAGLRWMRLTGSGGRTLADAETIFTTEFSNRNLFEASLGAHGEYTGTFAASKGLFASVKPRAWSMTGDLGLRALAGDTELEMNVRFAGVDSAAGRLTAEGLGALTVDTSLGARLLWSESELEASFGCARDTSGYSSVWGGAKAVVHF